MIETISIIGEYQIWTKILKFEPKNKNLSARLFLLINIFGWYIYLMKISVRYSMINFISFVLDKIFLPLLIFTFFRIEWCCTRFSLTSMSMQAIALSMHSQTRHLNKWAMQLSFFLRLLYYIQIFWEIFVGILTK